MILELCLGDRAPFGLIDFFTGALEREHERSRAVLIHTADGPAPLTTPRDCCVRSRLTCGVVPWHMVPSSSHQHRSTSVLAGRAGKLLNQALRFPSVGLHEAYTICSVAGDLKINETIDLRTGSCR